VYRGANKSLARPGRKQARKHVRDARDFNNIETRAVIKIFFFLQGKAPKEIHAILAETLTYLWDFVWPQKKTVIISLYSIKWMIFINETQSVYCAVRTGSLNKIPVKFSDQRVRFEDIYFSATGLHGKFYVQLMT